MTFPFSSAIDIIVPAAGAEPQGVLDAYNTDDFKDAATCYEAGRPLGCIAGNDGKASWYKYPTSDSTFAEIGYPVDPTQHTP